MERRNLSLLPISAWFLAFFRENSEDLKNEQFVILNCNDDNQIKIFWERDKTADFKRDKTANFQNRTKQPILKQYKIADW